MDHPNTFSPNFTHSQIERMLSRGFVPRVPGLAHDLIPRYVPACSPSTGACLSTPPVCPAGTRPADKSDPEALSPLLLAHPRGWNLSRHTPGLDLKTCVLHVLIVFPIQTPRPLPQAGQNHLCLAHTGAVINGREGV